MNTSLVFLSLPLAFILGSDFMTSLGIGDDHTTLGKVKGAKGVRLCIDRHGRRLVQTSVAYDEMLRLDAKYLMPI